MMRSLSVTGLGLLLAGSAFAQKSELRARELFYTPVPDVKAKVAEPKQSEAKAAAVKNEIQTPGRKVASTQANANRNESSTLSGGVKVQRASTAANAVAVVGPPLALKYRLLKRNADNNYDEVDTDTVFRSGDSIRFSVESNDSAYLYIVQQGSSKTWNLLFPNQETSSNRVERNREYDIPGSANRFTFDEQAGTERMFLILSRRPEADLEKLIYSLSQGGATSTKPASTGNAGEGSKMLIAQSRIDGGLIEQLRERDKVLARDLVFEKVNDDEKPVARPQGARKEKALYVATPDRTEAARIIVDLNLKHQ